MMRAFRKHKKQNATPRRDSVPDYDDQFDMDAGYNRNRDNTLYWRTAEGYIIAHDVVSQNAYVEQTPCAECGGDLTVIAVLNRAGQGLSELVAYCRDCKTRASFVFDISNDVYQDWWAEQLGPLYIQQYDGPPREPATDYGPD